MDHKELRQALRQLPNYRAAMLCNVCAVLYVLTIILTSWHLAAMLFGIAGIVSGVIAVKLVWKDVSDTRFFRPRNLKFVGIVMVVTVYGILSPQSIALPLAALGTLLAFIYATVSLMTQQGALEDRVQLSAAMYSATRCTVVCLATFIVFQAHVLVCHFSPPAPAPTSKQKVTQSRHSPCNGVIG